MTDTALDPEEGSDYDFPHCEAMNGLGPHHYVPHLDLFTGTQYLYCIQCGDTMVFIDAPTGGAQPAPTTVVNNASPAAPTAPTTPPKANWP